MTDTPAFPGFPQAGLDFLRALAQNNTREWFEPRKDDYKRLLRDPALAFVAAMGARLQTIAPDIRADLRTNGAGSLMRINRDTRFSADKSPYKTELPIMWWEGPGKKTQHPAFGLRIRAAGEADLMTGMFGFDKIMLEAFRAAVADDQTGVELADALADVTGQGYGIVGEHYKRVPSGYDADHPRADLLRYNALYAYLSDIPAAVITTPDLVDVCFEHFRAMAPVHRWLVAVARRAGLQ